MFILARYAGILALLLALPMSSPSDRESPQANEAKRIVLDDFESYPVGGLPTRWHTYKRRGDIRPVSPEMMSPNEYFEIVEEKGNRFVRGHMIDQAHRLLMGNGEHFDWDVKTHPVIGWRWRAIDIPEGAREDQEETNDSVAAFYVVFKKNWLGIPKIIKYVYSSTLPVGTTASYGQLKVLVLASAPQNGIGKWMSFKRDVRKDYRFFFGEDPPRKPGAIMLWMDSDNMQDGVAVADFDDVVLYPEP